MYDAAVSARKGRPAPRAKTGQLSSQPHTFAVTFLTFRPGAGYTTCRVTALSTAVLGSQNVST